MKNYQKINFDKLKAFDFKIDETQILNFYKQIIEEILLPNKEALELLKNLSIINTELETNIDRICVEKSYKISDIERIFNELMDTRIIKNKEGRKDIYEFSTQYIQNALKLFTDENSHKKAIKYYERKRIKFGVDLNDEIEILFHMVKINPTEELVNKFLTIVKTIDQFAFRYKRLIDVAEELIKLEDKYKAPILVVLGDLFSVMGRAEDAERSYLDALENYKNLAKKYYKIYLPYIAATQKNLGTLYIDLKRFEEAEMIYLDVLKVYKELDKQFYDVHSPEIDLTQNNIVKNSVYVEKSYLDDLNAYTKLLKQYYDVYLPDETSIANHFGNVCIDLNLLEDIQDGSIDSTDSYRKLAKMCYDMYLTDVASTQGNLGIIYSEELKFEDAEQMHLEALKIKKKLAEQYPDQVLPELAITLIDLGDLYASQNKFEEAEPMYLEGLKISKQLAEQYPDIYLFNVAIIQNCLGTVYIKLEKFEQVEPLYLDALKIFKIFAKEHPKTYLVYVAEVQNNLGNTFMILRNLEKAEYYLNKALKIDRTNSDVLYNIACLESLKNNQKKALEMLKKAIDLDKNYVERALLDERFDNIRNLKEFEELINAIIKE